MEMKTIKNWIGGQWIASHGERKEVPNPATGEILAEVPLSTKEELDQAVQVAQEAFHSWKKTPVPRRARILFKYQQL